MNTDVNELLQQVEESSRQLDAMSRQESLDADGVVEYHRRSREHLDLMATYMRAVLAQPDLPDRERVEVERQLASVERSMAVDDDSTRAWERAKVRVGRVLADEGVRAEWLADLRELVGQVERAVEVYAQIPWPHDVEGRRVRQMTGHMMTELSLASWPMGELYDAGRQTAEERALDDRVLAVGERYDNLPGPANLAWEVEMLVAERDALDDAEEES